ncbi:hypothetical protein BKA65DRAFT_562436 [Rhexocercosporidium sp. MPI-PUGE-AT-0058]|nr:hypothetical protein BKA65DRAFT_562436 [Rhexocercosporidium sp. MPI-PUGE-AT-0058]
MTEISSYEYSHLGESGSIRLLLVHPGLPSYQMNCSLIHTMLSECHTDIYIHYTTPTYLWGAVNQRRVVYVEDKDFEVATNLAAAPEDLRGNERILRLWAEAVSIDQSCIPERNHQVGLMREIYAYAHHTIIHLGESDDACRPWIHFGRDRISWDVLYAACFSSGSSSGSMATKVPENPSSSREGKHPHSAVSLVECYRDTQEARKPSEIPTLFAVMVSRRRFGVTGPRELLYGHLPVARLPSLGKDSACLVVDYQRSTAEILTDVTIYICKKRHSYGSLLHVKAHYSRAGVGISGLPSWVPDWTFRSPSVTPPFPSDLGYVPPILIMRYKVIHNGKRARGHFRVSWLKVLGDDYVAIIVRMSNFLRQRFVLWTISS